MTSVTTTNPATGEVRTLPFTETIDAQVLALCERAHAALEDFSTRPLVWRAGLLRAMAEELEADAPTLVALAHEETALPLARLEGELRRTAFQLRFFADVVTDGSFLDATIDHATESPMGALPDLRRMRIALGAVGVFGSSNFPFAFSVPGGDTASALAAGCPVVIKAHPAHPATSAAAFAALERGAKRCEAPEGVLNLLFGLSAGTALVQASPISAIGFTGSVAAGRALWALANARDAPIPFFGELGSANPLVVTPSACDERAEEIGAGFAGSMTLGAGQFCTKPGLLFVPTGSRGDALVAAIVTALEAATPFTMLTSGIAEHFRSGSAAIAASGDTRSLVARHDSAGAQAVAQLFEVDAEQFALDHARVLRDECFGPLAVVVRYDSDATLRDALGASAPSLTFSLFCAEHDEGAQWLLDAAAQRAGRVIVNGFPTGVAVSWSMQHGGPWPSTTSSASTSVGAGAIERWLRPVTYQSVPDDLLPAALRDANPSDVPRRVDGDWTRER